MNIIKKTAYLIKTKRQIHVNANRDIVEELNAAYHTDYSWGELFKKLFKPTETLINIMQDYQAKIGGAYYSAVFRFQNLLGDFEEYNYKPLKAEAKNKLMAKCKQALLALQQSITPKRMLVTSDSVLFLQKVANMENIFVFPSKVVHLDTVKNERHEVYLKSFLDFFLLSEGVKIYSIGTEEMYKSEFPMYAAKVNNRPFERIILK